MLKTELADMTDMVLIFHLNSYWRRQTEWKNKLYFLKKKKNNKKKNKKKKTVIPNV